MRIAIDAAELSGKTTGVGRYLAQLLAAWSQLPEAAAHEFVLCAAEPLAMPQGLRGSVSVAAGRGTRWRQLALPRLLARARPDLLFAPAYEAPLLAGVPVVLAVHDVSFVAHPEWFAPRERVRRRILTTVSARRAAAILTFSEFSRREIVQRLGVPAERVHVVYHGVTRFPGVGTRNDRNDHGDSNAILYVGSIFNRRHVPELIEGFARLAARRPEVRLEVVGENRTQPRLDLDALVARSDAGGRLRASSYVPEDRLRTLYATARAFVFLSDYEGFGLTPLEAMAADVPVLVLDTEVTREIYGEAALYLSRPEPPLIEHALERLLYDAGLRERLAAARPGVLARYSWRECAARTLHVLAADHRR